MKFLIIGSKSDPASRNIMMNLMDIGGFNFHFIDGDMLNEKNLDFEKIKQHDFIIFASKHKSEKREKTLSIHAPGILRERRGGEHLPNSSNAEPRVHGVGGGEQGKLSPSSALFQKYLFNVLTKQTEKAELKYKVTLEATHHGPLINKPCLFIEIGSGPDEWRDRRASFVIAKTIREAVTNYKPNQYNEIAIGIGGPHYCPSFNKIQLTSNIALSHIIPGYVQPITKEMILEAIEKTKEEVDFAVIDWKGLGKAEERQTVIDILEKNYIYWKKTGEIKK